MPALTPGQRASLALRISIAVEFERPFLPKGSAQIRRLYLDRTRTLADRLLLCSNEPACDALIAHAVEELKRDRARDAAIWNDSDAVGARVMQQLDRLIDRLEQLEWRLCVRDGMVSEDTICEIEGLRQLVERRVRDLYVRHARDPEVPAVNFITEGIAHGANYGVFPHFHVNGWTRVRRHESSATIGLQIQDQGLDLTTMRQILYVLTHELVCHAYQSLRDASRRNSDDICSWSDGWMDALAWMLTESLIEGDPELPEWFHADREGAKRECRSLHDRRFEPPALAPLNEVHLQLRQWARSAFHSLRNVWRGSGTDINGSFADERITEFSLQINHSSLTNEERDLLINRLIMGLLDNDADPRAPMQVAGICSEFCLRRDVLALDRALERLIPVST